MVLSDGFAGKLGQGMAASIVVNTTTVPFHEILDVDPPGRSFKKANYTPQSGTLAGKEQVLVASESAATMSLTVVYEKAHHAAIETVSGINGSAITLTLSDGSTLVGTGAISANSLQQLSDAKEMTAKVTLELNAGWTFTAGS